MAYQPEASGMTILVKGKNVEVVPALREYAQRKVGKLSRYFESHDAVRAEVVVGTFRGQYQAEVTLQLGGRFLRGAGKGPDALAAVDEAAERAERQFLRFKARLESAKSQTAGSTTVRMPAPEQVEERRDAVGDEPRVVRTKRFAFKPMSVDEAILQMELLGHDFFVFVNESTDEVNVLYRRRDGNYGLIEPGE